MRCVGERFADVNVVDRVAHGGGGGMGRAYVMDKRNTGCILLMAFECTEIRDEILRPIVVPFIHDHHLMLQHDNARPHVARVCTWKLKTFQFLHGQHTHRTMSPIEHIWDALDRV